MFTPKTLTVIMSITALTACGGGGGGGGSSAFNSLFQDANRISNSFADAPALPYANRPSGNATYDGIAVVGLETPSNDLIDILGETEVSVNFNTDQLSATASDFRTSNGTDVAGQFSIDASIAQGQTDGQIVGAGSGRIVVSRSNFPSGADADLNLTVTTPDFRGSGADYLFVPIVGSAADGTEFVGTLISEKD